MRPKFKSFTDINNYNNFLLDLDKKHNKIEKVEKNINASVSDVIKEIDKTYHSFEYNSNNFTGENRLDKLLDVLRNVDPNLYDMENNSNPECNPACNVKTGKKIVIPNIKPTAQGKTDQKKSELEPIIKHHVNISAEINNIGDLLSLIDQYSDIKETKYNINMKSLHKIKEPLNELNNMIGMKSLKENIVDQILFYIQNLHKTTGDSKKVSNDFMHTVIYGPPGTGKTEIAKIMGKIFSKIGVLEKGTFKKVTRSDLIAGYLGQTAIKTTEVIKECLGGVLFIDEAYALGNQEKKDIFSKECIDTICEALSNHKDNLMVIIAGYETDLNDCFFNYNQGLNSRFTWRFKTDDYSGEDLYKIFIKKVHDDQWSFSENGDENITVKWFEKNKRFFKFYGRDIETLFGKVKIAHSRRVFCLDDNIKKKLTIKDIDKGLEMFKKNDNNNNKDENFKKMVSSMYL